MFGYWSIRRMESLAARSLICVLAPLLPALAGAAPPVFEPTVTLTAPAPHFRDVHSVAMDGDYAVVSFYAEDFQTDEEGAETFIIEYAPVIYRRLSNGNWQQQQMLSKVFRIASAGDWSSQSFMAMRGNVIALVSFDELYVFERVGNVWQESPVARDVIHPIVSDVKIDNGTIVMAGCNLAGLPQARAFRKNSVGTWVMVSDARGTDQVHCDTYPMIHAAVSGNTLILTADDLADHSGGARYFFRGAPTTWAQPSQRFTTQIFRASPVAVSGNLAILGGSDLYRYSGGLWTFEQNLQPAGRSGAAQIRGDLAASGHYPAVSVYEADASLDFSEIARLTIPGGTMSAGSIDMQGRRIISDGAPIELPEAYIYELPAVIPPQPAMIQDTFQSGSADRWTPHTGSWSVAATPATSVYRQGSLTADGTTLLDNADWTNQAVQADVRPTAFSGSDRWFGLAVRRMDASNYYYLTARSSGVVQLKRMLNGSFQTLASADLPVVENTSYRLRLEAIGTTIKAYVNGLEVLSAIDASVTHGQVALMSYKAAVDFDNVIASPSPQTTVLNDDFSNYASDWTLIAGAWRIVDFSGTSAYYQGDASGGASSVTQSTAVDQSVQARVFEWGVGTGTQPWFGLMARYRDASNYYYVTVRNSQEISLRRLLNGTTQVLDSARFAVNVGAWYSLRIEAIADQLRVYVDNELILEATDNAISDGRQGAAMYKAITEYDDVLITQP